MSQNDARRYNFKDHHMQVIPMLRCKCD